MKRSFLAVFAAVAGLTTTTTEGFSIKKATTTTTTTTTNTPTEQHQLSRRDAITAASFGLTSSLLVGVFTAAPPPARAATAEGITDSEKKRIQEGYRQIQYLLDNFEQETTVCRENGGECKRDANAIRKTLGLRSTTDPLFQIEKVFAKVKNMDDLDFDKLDAFYDAAEDWNSAMNMSNSMAFISQFGEYNPGGGKDEVLKYLLESKKQVVLARDSLKTIMQSLDLPTD